MPSSATSAARKKPPPAASPLGDTSADESPAFYRDHRRQSLLTPTVTKTFPVRSATPIPGPRSPVPFLIRDLFLVKKGAQDPTPQASSPASSAGSVIQRPPQFPSDAGAEDSTTFFTARASDATTIVSSVGDGYGGVRRYKISDAADARRSEDEYDYADDECSSSSCRSSLSGIDGSSRGSGGPNKPHKANDARWEAIRLVRCCEGPIGLSHFRLMLRLGHGDIGTVYLAKLKRTGNLFAMKVMDKAQLVSRNKLVRARTEKDILHALDHPFLPTLYTDFETDKYSCLVMEYCPGGDLHTLRQKQPGRRFGEQAARFYVAEVLLALEYLHMLGIIYRDLKPENVLVRDDGHIMLSDFDLSLRCAVFPMLVHTTEMDLLLTKNPTLPIEPSCIEPTCLQPTCFSPRCIGVGRSKSKKAIANNLHKQDTPLPELIAEPTNARSMSFVGTHEYLAPEIIKGEGHGSSVDWWTFGIFLYELLFGTTPFKGSQNRATLFNVIGEPLKFPEKPAVSFAARDLIRRLLEKEPQQRLGFNHGAAEIKQHPFFRSINWALIRCTKPPQSPKVKNDILAGGFSSLTEEDLSRVDLKSSGQYLDLEF